MLMSTPSMSMSLTCSSGMYPPGRRSSILWARPVISGCSNLSPVSAPAAGFKTRCSPTTHMSPSSSPRLITRGARSLYLADTLLVHKSPGSKTWLSDEMMR